MFSFIKCYMCVVISSSIIHLCVKKHTAIQADYDRDQLNKKAKNVKNDKEHVEEVWQHLSTLSYTEKTQSFWIFDQQHRSMKCSIISNHICQCNLFSTILQQS